MILFRIIHKNFIESWSDYTKSRSFRHGARWNSASVPVMYFSVTAQNAMLEIANYAPSPRMANKLFRMVAFEFSSLRLYRIVPEELPAEWNADEFGAATQALGDKLLGDEGFDGLLAPSTAINEAIVTHPRDEVRQSAYANVIVNLEKVGMSTVTVLDSYRPIFSQRMF